LALIGGIGWGYGDEAASSQHTATVSRTVRCRPASVDGRRARARRMAGSRRRSPALHRLRGLLRCRQASFCRSRLCSRTLRISALSENAKAESNQARRECASCGCGRDGRVPVWPPADTPSHRDVSVTPQLSPTSSSGYATSVLARGAYAPPGGLATVRTVVSPRGGSGVRAIALPRCSPKRSGSTAAAPLSIVMASSCSAIRRRAHRLR
jgi:hypothetical protein